MIPEHPQILQRVQDIIREQLSFGPEVPVPPDADFYAELGGDSLDLAEITMNLEEDFEINIPDGAAPSPVTPASPSSSVRGYLKTQVADLGALRQEV